MGRVVVVGSYNADLTVVGPRLPAPGETVLGRAFTIGPGGKGSNQAIGARRLGADVTLVAKLGDDAFGAAGRELFAREGLVGPGLLTAPTHTGVALIVVDDRGRNMIAVAPGANAQLTGEDVAGIAGLFDGASHLLCQLECPLEVFVRAAGLARARGAITILDPAPAVPLTDDVLRSVDVLTPNETELATLTGAPVATERDVAAAARSLVRRGAGRVVVTLGERGAVCVGRDGVFVVPAVPVTAVDATGAGDAFNAGLAAGLAAGEDLGAALALAARAGAYCAARSGVLEGLASRDVLDRELPR